MIMTRTKCSLRVSREMHPGEQIIGPSTLSHMMTRPRVIPKWTERENNLVRIKRKRKPPFSYLKHFGIYFLSKDRVYKDRFSKKKKNHKFINLHNNLRLYINSIL